MGDTVVNPPRPGEPSFESWNKEVQGTLDSLKRRAKLVAETLNSIEGIHCNTVQGAMYAFPQITLPEKALEAAKEAGQPGMCSTRSICWSRRVSVSYLAQVSASVLALFT